MESYAILENTNKHKLETEVIRYMKEGWTVSGGVMVFIVDPVIIYYQAVVRT